MKIYERSLDSTNSSMMCDFSSNRDRDAVIVTMNIRNIFDRESQVSKRILETTIVEHDRHGRMVDVETQVEEL